MYEFFTTYILPAVGILMSIVIVPLAGLAGAVLTKKLQEIGLKIEASDREAFQTAITNGAKLAVSKMGGPAATNSVSQIALDAGVKQVLQGVPDAIKRLDVPVSEIEKRILPQALEIAQSVPTVAGLIAETNPLINVIPKKNS